MLYRPDGCFTIEPEFLTADRPLRQDFGRRLPRASSSPALARVEALTSQPHSTGDGDNCNENSGRDGQALLSARSAPRQLIGLRSTKGTIDHPAQQPISGSPVLSSSVPSASLRTADRTKSLEGIGYPTSSSSSSAAKTHNTAQRVYWANTTSSPSCTAQQAQAQTADSPRDNGATLASKTPVTDVSDRVTNEGERIRKPKIDFASILAPRSSLRSSTSRDGSSPKTSVSCWDLRDSTQASRTASYKRVSSEDLTPCLRTRERTAPRRVTLSTSADLSPIVRRSLQIGSDSYSGSFDAYLEAKQSRRSLDNLRLTSTESPRAGDSCSETTRVDSGNGVANPTLRSGCVGRASLASNIPSKTRLSLPSLGSPDYLAYSSFNRKLSSDPDKIFERSKEPLTPAVSSSTRPCPSKTIADSNRAQSSTSISSSRTNNSDDFSQLPRNEARILLRPYSNVEARSPQQPSSVTLPAVDDAEVAGRDRSLSSRFKSLTDLRYSPEPSKSTTSTPSDSGAHYSSLRDLRMNTSLSAPRSTGSLEKLQLPETRIRRTAEIYDMFPKRDSDECSTEAEQPLSNGGPNSARRGSPSAPRSSEDVATRSVTTASGDDTPGDDNQPPPLPTVPPPPLVDGLAYSAADEKAVGVNTHSDLGSQREERLMLPRRLVVKPAMMLSSADDALPLRPIHVEGDSKPAQEVPRWVDNFDSSVLDQSRRSSATRNDTDGFASHRLGYYRDGSYKGVDASNLPDTTQTKTSSAAQQTAVQQPPTMVTNQSRFDWLSKPSSGGPPKPPRGNVRDPSCEPLTLPRNIGRSHSSFGFENGGSLRRAATLDSRRARSSAGGDFNRSLSTSFYPTELDPFADCSGADQNGDDANEDDNFDNLVSVSTAPSAYNTLSSHTLQESTNPFGSDSEEADDKSIASTTFSSIMGYCQQPVSSTPHGTLKRKFGGAGLTSVWPSPTTTATETATVASTTAGERGFTTYDDSLNPFAESDTESALSATSSNILSSTSLGTPYDSNKPAVLPKRKMKSTKKKRAPPPPGQSQVKSTTPEVTSSLQVTPLSRRAAEEPGSDLYVSHNDDSNDNSGKSSPVDLNVSRPFPPLPPLPNNLEQGRTDGQAGSVSTDHETQSIASTDFDNMAKAHRPMSGTSPTCDGAISEKDEVKTRPLCGRSPTARHRPTVPPSSIRHPMLAFRNSLVNDKDLEGHDSSEGDFSCTDTSSTSDSEPEELQKSRALREACDRVVSAVAAAAPIGDAVLAEAEVRPTESTLCQNKKLNEVQERSCLGEVSRKTTDEDSGCPEVIVTLPEKADNDTPGNEAGSQHTVAEITSAQPKKLRSPNTRTPKSKRIRFQRRRRRARPIIIKYIYQTIAPWNPTTAMPSEASDKTSSQSCERIVVSPPKPQDTPIKDQGAANRMPPRPPPKPKTSLDFGSEGFAHDEDQCVRSDSCAIPIPVKNQHDHLPHPLIGASTASTSPVVQELAEVCADVVVGEALQFSILPVTISPPEFDFKDPTTDGQHHEALPQLQLVTTEEFEIHQNDLPDVDEEWDEYASTSDSSIISEDEVNDFDETAEVRKTQRSLSPIAEVPDEESDCEKDLETKRVASSPPVETSFISDRAGELSAGFEKNGAAQFKQEAAGIPFEGVEAFGDIIFLPSPWEEAKTFEVYKMNHCIDTDQASDITEVTYTETEELHARSTKDSADRAISTEVDQSTTFTQALHPNESTKISTHSTSSAYSCEAASSAATFAVTSDSIGTNKSEPTATNGSSAQDILTCPVKDVFSNNGATIAIIAAALINTDRADSSERTPHPQGERTADNETTVAITAKTTTTTITSPTTMNEAHCNSTGGSPNTFQDVNNIGPVTVLAYNKPEQQVPDGHCSLIIADISDRQKLNALPDLVTAHDEQHLSTGAVRATSPIPICRISIDAPESLSGDEDLRNENPVANLNKLLLKESMQRRKDALTLTLPDRDMAHSPIPMGSTEELASPLCSFEQTDNMPRARTLPLPSPDLIKRRYSDGDTKLVLRLNAKMTSGQCGDSLQRTRSHSVNVLMSQSSEPDSFRPLEHSEVTSSTHPTTNRNEAAIHGDVVDRLSAPKTSPNTVGAGSSSLSSKGDATSVRAANGGSGAALAASGTQKGQTVPPLPPPPALTRLRSSGRRRRPLEAPPPRPIRPQSPNAIMPPSAIKPHVPPRPAIVAAGAPPPTGGQVNAVPGPTYMGATGTAGVDQDIPRPKSLAERFAEAQLAAHGTGKNGAPPPLPSVKATGIGFPPPPPPIPPPAPPLARSTAQKDLDIPTERKDADSSDLLEGQGLAASPSVVISPTSSTKPRSLAERFEEAQALSKTSVKRLPPLVLPKIPPRIVRPKPALAGQPALPVMSSQSPGPVATSSTSSTTTKTFGETEVSSLCSVPSRQMPGPLEAVRQAPDQPRSTRLPPRPTRQAPVPPRPTRQAPMPPSERDVKLTVRQSPPGGAGYDSSLAAMETRQSQSQSAHVESPPADSSVLFPTVGDALSANRRLRAAELKNKDGEKKHRQDDELPSCRPSNDCLQPGVSLEQTSAQAPDPAERTRTVETPSPTSSQPNLLSGAAAAAPIEVGLQHTIPSCAEEEHTSLTATTTTTATATTTAATTTEAATTATTTTTTTTAAPIEAAIQDPHQATMGSSSLAEVMDLAVTRDTCPSNSLFSSSSTPSLPQIACSPNGFDSGSREDILFRSRAVSVHAERILGRAVDFNEEEERISHRKRDIEEKQANLSAEARLVERQIWEAAKGICGDSPRIVLDQGVGKYFMANEENAELVPDNLVNDLYRILNLKNQLAEKYNQLEFLQRYNELQRDQVDIEARLRNLADSANGGPSFMDANYERVLMQRLMEVITQRNHLVEVMDEQNRRKRALLSELSQSLSDLSVDSFSSVSIKSSKSLGSLDKGHLNGKKSKKKRHGVKNFLKKRYHSLVKRTSHFAHGSSTHDRLT